MASQDFTEYQVKFGQAEHKKFNIMRFKPPHKCDLEKLVNPRLDRQETKVEEDNSKVEYGEGTEYRQKEREEARRRKRGIRTRRVNPDDQPWILREQKKGGKHFIGRKEGGINNSASYYLMSLGQDNTFEVYPVSNWYDFVPPVKYNYLNDEEAEEKFEKRNKTLNYFSIMVSKRIKEKEEGSEEVIEEKTKKQQHNDSEDEFSSVGGSDDEKPTTSKKVKAKPKPKKPKSQSEENDSEAGEETDEGDMESQEMDYFSSSSSDKEEEERKAVQEQPRDDAEVERKEDQGIDKVFAESSSSEEEDDLTESGKELKALMHKQIQDTSIDDDETEKDNTSADNTQPTNTTSKSSDKIKSKKGFKREAESLDSQLPSSSTPPAKKLKTESLSVITPEEVKRYLLRKPMTLKALLKKFIKLKTEMTKQDIVRVLAKIVQAIPQIERREVNGKKYLSLQGP